ncbi:unnamed protein product [Moneuplotes crassus]|uniref:Uncharacterized protein n=1 Tax=Euplotes crassus TaxID=5936 RepID=A0AAD1U4M0_EUPCR|nr:unnamed protein product [Moneuplotes crassus]
MKGKTLTRVTRNNSAQQSANQDLKNIKAPFGFRKDSSTVLQKRREVDLQNPNCTNIKIETEFAVNFTPEVDKGTRVTVEDIDSFQLAPNKDSRDTKLNPYTHMETDPINCFSTQKVSQKKSTKNYSKIYNYNDKKSKSRSKSGSKEHSMRFSADKLKFVSGGGLKYSSLSSKRRMTKKGLEIACLIPAPKKTFKFEKLQSEENKFIRHKNNYVSTFSPTEIQDIIHKRNLEKLQFNSKTISLNKLSKINGNKTRYSRKTLCQLREAKLRAANNGNDSYIKIKETSIAGDAFELKPKKKRTIKSAVHKKVPIKILANSLTNFQILQEEKNSQCRFISCNQNQAGHKLIVSGESCDIDQLKTVSNRNNDNILVYAKKRRSASSKIQNSGSIPKSNKNHYCAQGQITTSSQNENPLDEDLGQSTIVTKDSIPRLLPNYQAIDFKQSIDQKLIHDSVASAQSKSFEFNTSRSVDESEVAIKPRPTIKCEIKTILNPENSTMNFNSSRVDIAETKHGKAKKKASRKRKKILPKFGSSSKLGLNSAKQL